MQQNLQFFEENKNTIENLRNEKEIIEFFAANNFFIDKNFLKSLKLKYNNSTKLNNSQLEKVAGGAPSPPKRSLPSIPKETNLSGKLGTIVQTTVNLSRSSQNPSNLSERCAVLTPLNRSMLEDMEHNSQYPKSNIYASTDLTTIDSVRRNLVYEF